MKKVKGLRSTNWLLRNSDGDVKYSIRNIVNTILITMYGVIMGVKFIGMIT